LRKKVNPDYNPDATPAKKMKIDFQTLNLNNEEIQPRQSSCGMAVEEKEEIDNKGYM
jgi:hypothetical protein